jgi:hypothetical protein
MAVRRAVSNVADADLPSDLTFPDAPSLPQLTCEPDIVTHPLADPLLADWGLNLLLGEIDGEAVLAAGPRGRSCGAVMGSGLQIWRAAGQVTGLTGWTAPRAVLIGGEESAVAVGMASWAGDPALLVAAARDACQVAGVNVLLTKLTDKLRDYGPRYQPGVNAPASHDAD